jgi:outer membrane protein TolC
MRSIIAFLFFSQIASAQEVLKYADFNLQVLANHPLGKQALYTQNRAETNILTAKAAFDPILTFENSQKTLNDKVYFNYSLAEIVYQSPFALKLKTGFEVSSGGFLNPENTPGSLGFLGIEMPLLQGLLTDYKRTEIQKTILYAKQSEADRRLIMNNLVLESSAAYFDWLAHYELYRLLDSYLINAKKRLELIKLGFRNGERAQIDTVEADLQYQKIVLLRNEASLEFIKSRLALARYLWTDDQKPYFLATQILPDTLAYANLVFANSETQLITEFYKQHPELQIYELKRDALKVTKKLYGQYFLPELILKANLLNQKNISPEFVFAQPLNENYKFGFDFRFPLLLRDARGKKQEINFRLLENQNEIDLKRWEIENKIRSYGQEIQLVNEQLGILINMQKGLKSLLDNELFKLKNGESTLFLINTRENALLENYEKLIKTKLKLVQKTLGQKWAAGVLYEK